jgi:hypothetical protein
MRIRHPKRMMPGEHYAMIPDEVLVSPALTTLPHYCGVLLMAIAAQYRGMNGGDLAMTGSIARRYGIRSKKQLVAGLRLLQQHGLIRKTLQGGKRPLGPCLYAVTWRQIDACGGKLEIGPTTAPSNAWTKWMPAPTEKTTPLKRRHPRGTRSAPVRDQSLPVSALRVDQTLSIHSTPEGASSRVWPKGTDTLLLVRSAGNDVVHDCLRIPPVVGW